MTDPHDDDILTFQPVYGFPNSKNNNNDLEKQGLQWYCAPDSWEKKNDNVNDNNNSLPVTKEENTMGQREEGQGGWWKVVPSEVEVQENDDNKHTELWLAPPAKKDFWRKTYYQPLLVKDDGPFLYSKIHQSYLPVTIETSFSITGPTNQFDQAGVMIRLDAEHWIKTGIEIVDGMPRLSCVVTNSFSDWSTQSWTISHDKPAQAKIRVHLLPQHGGSFVVEAAPVHNNSSKEDDWSFVRIAHMNQNMKHDLLHDDPIVLKSFHGESAPKDCFMVGIFAACPVDQCGMVAKFHHLSITQGSSFVHDF